MYQAPATGMLQESVHGCIYSDLIHQQPVSWNGIMLYRYNPYNSNKTG